MVVWKLWVWPTKKTGLSVSVLVYLGLSVSTSIKSVQVRSTTATSRTCTNPPSGRQIPLYNTVKWHLKLLILVSCLYVPVYWTHMVSSDQRILSVTVLVSFRGFFQTTWMWRGASVWTLHHETQWLTFWNFLYPHKVLWGQPRVTFKFLVMSFTENLFFLLLLGSGRWTALGSSLPQITVLIKPSLVAWFLLMFTVSSDTLFRQGHSKFIKLT